MRLCASLCGSDTIDMSGSDTVRPCVDPIRYEWIRYGMSGSDTVDGSYFIAADVTSYVILTFGNPLGITSCVILTFGNPLGITSCVILTFGNPLGITSCVILTFGNPLGVTSCVVLTFGNPLDITSCVILIVRLIILLSVLCDEIDSETGQEIQYVRNESARRV